MMQKNRNYITLKGFAIIIAMIIIAAIGVRIFLRTNFKQAYTNPNPSGTDGPEGFGKLQESKDKQYYYRIRLKDKALMIVSYRGEKRRVKVPEKIDNYQVKIIGDSAYSTKSKLEKITIQYNLESIGMAAFSDDPRLKNITIAGKMQELDENAFYGVKCWIETYKNSNVYQLAKQQHIKVKYIGKEAYK